MKKHLIILLSLVVSILTGCKEEKIIVAGLVEPLTVEELLAEEVLGDTIFYEKGKYGGFPINSCWIYAYEKYQRHPMTGEVFMDLKDTLLWVVEKDTLLGHTLYQGLAGRFLRVWGEEYFQYVQDIDGQAQEWKYMDGELTAGAAWSTDTIRWMNGSTLIGRFDQFEITKKSPVINLNGRWYGQVVEVKHTINHLYNNLQIRIPTVYIERYAKDVGLLDRKLTGSADTRESQTLLRYSIVDEP